MENWPEFPGECRPTDMVSWNDADALIQKTQRLWKYQLASSIDQSGMGRQNLKDLIVKPQKFLL